MPDRDTDEWPPVAAEPPRNDYGYPATAKPIVRLHDGIRASDVIRLIVALAERVRPDSPDAIFRTQSCVKESVADITDPEILAWLRSSRKLLADRLDPDGVSALTLLDEF